MINNSEISWWASRVMEIQAENTQEKVIKQLLTGVKDDSLGMEVNTALHITGARSTGLSFAVSRETKPCEENSPICRGCKKPKENGKFCGLCKKAYYCCKECQKLDWNREHKLSCSGKIHPKISPNDFSTTIKCNFECGIDHR